jgi:nitrite reductase/ring-hydroxylating ferredoxin subunit
MPGVEQWVTVLANSELADGEVVGTTVGLHEIAIYRIGGELFATDNVCTHALAFLSDGWLDGEVVECPLHGGRFEVKSGKGLGPPITCDLKTYATRVFGGEVQILISRDPAT